MKSNFPLTKQVGLSEQIFNSHYLAEQRTQYEHTVRAEKINTWSRDQ